MRREGTSTKPGSVRARWKAEAVFEELKQLAERVGLEVREEKLLREVGYQVRSGACRFREQDLVLIDRDLPLSSRLDVLVEVLSGRELGEVYVSPELRRILGREESA